MSSSALDIRLRIDFWDHPKTIKLQRRAGREAAEHLQRLWCWCRGAHPDGDLAGLTDEDIEIAAKWPGDTGALVRALAEVGFVEGEEGARILHDWDDEQPWAREAAARSESARNAAKAKWQRVRDAAAVREQCDRSAPASKPHCPSPLLSSPNLTETRPDRDQTEESPLPPAGDVTEGKSKNCPYQAIVDLYHEVFIGHPRVRVIGESLKRQMKCRWQEDTARQDLAWWGSYFHEAHQRDFLTGRIEGDPRPFYADLEFLTRPSKMVKILNGGYPNVSANPRLKSNAQRVNDATFDAIRQAGQNQLKQIGPGDFFGGSLPGGGDDEPQG